MRESIYRFKPVGHNPPDQKRSYAKPDQRLRKVFEEWLEEVVSIKFAYYLYYLKACELTKNLNPYIPEAHSLLVAYQDHEKIEYAGLFLSAIYNRSSEKEIVFDLDLDLENPLYGLGHRLQKGKQLVIRGKTGDWTGYEASGIVINFGETGFGMGRGASGMVINYGKADNEMGSEASGVVINFGETGFGMGRGASGVVIHYGKADNGMGYGASGVVINFSEADKTMGFLTSGLVINCGKADERMGEFAKGIVLALRDPASFGDISRAKLVLKAEDCKKIPELGEYLENLRRTLEAGRQDYQAVLAWLEGFGEEPGERIKSDIEEILRRVGYTRFKFEGFKYERVHLSL